MRYDLEKTHVAANVRRGFAGRANVGGALSWSVRRRIMQALRASVRVLGMRRKHRGLGPINPGNNTSRSIAGAAMASVPLALLLATVSTPALAGTCVQGAVVSDTQVNNGTAPVNCSDTSVAIGGGNGANASNNSVAIGDEATASGTDSTAVGPDSAATGNQATAIGTRAGARGVSSIAIGSNAVAATAALNGIAMGLNANVQGLNSVAIGTGSTVSGAHSLSIGTGNVISGADSGAFGGRRQSSVAGNNISGDASFAVGNDNNITSSNSFVIGNSATVTGQRGVALGVNARVSSGDAVALGSQSVANTPGGIAGYDPRTGIASTNTSTTWNSSLGAVSLGGINPLDPGVTATRQITNLAAGAKDNDAVNVAQLKAAMARYFSVNATDVGPGSNYANNGATGTNAVAIGLKASAAGEDGIALGTDTTSGETGYNVAIGANGTSANANSTVEGAVAIGVSQSAIGDGAVSLGSYNTANGDGSVAIGRANLATGPGSLAIGDSVTATGGRAVALGSTASAMADSGVALGNGAMADSGDSAVAIGRIADASGKFSIAMGDSAKALADDTLALGSNARSDGISSIAIGTGSVVSGDRSIAIGVGHAITGNRSGAFGDPNTIAGDDSYAIGNDNVIDADQAFVLGNNVTIVAGTDRAVSLGHNSSVTVADGVALGAGSVANTVVGTASATINGTVYNFAGTAPLSTVSVGAAGAERTITNVAAGRIGASSTDAINGSQLHATNQAVAVAAQAANAGWNLTDATGNAANIGPGGTVAFEGDGNIRVTQTGTDDDGKIEVALNPDVDLTSAGSLTVGNTLLDTDGVVISGGANGIVRLTGSGLDNGGNRVTNVAAGAIGATSTDAVNGSQLFALGNSTASALGGGSVYNPTTGQIIAALSVGGTTYNNVQDALTQLSATAGAGWNISAQGANATNVAAGSATGSTVDFRSSDGNVVVSKDTTSNDIDFALADDIAVDSVAAGNTTVDTNGVSIAGGPNGTVSLTGSGLDNGGNRITNVAAGVAATDAVNVSQLNAAMGNINIGFAGNSGAAVTRSSGQVLAIQGGGTTTGSYSGGNIRTVTDPGSGAINIEMAEAPKFGAVTVNDGGTGKISGVTAATLSSTSTEAVNGSQLVALGDSIAASLSPGSTYNPATNGITAQIVVGNNVYSNVQAALQAVAASSGGGGWTLASGANGSGVATGNASAPIAPGATATFVAGNNMMINQSGRALEVALNPNLTGIQSIAITGGPTINGNGIDMGGDRITNVGAAIAPGDAVNLGQMNAGLANTLGQANRYTDTAIADIRFDLTRQRRDANGGTAAAMAMSQVPQAFEPGMGIAGVGMSTWQGEQAIAFGFSKASDNGRVVVRATGSYNSRSEGGAAVGFGFQF